MLFPGIAAYAVVCLLRVVGLTRMTLGAWFVAAPALYFLWMLAYLALCTIHIQALFWGYTKPRHAVLAACARDAAPHVRLAISYGRCYLVKSLPFMQGLVAVPWLRTLYLLSYSPRTRIGKNVFLTGFLYDPDLTEIGDNVVLGGGFVMSAHALASIRPDVQSYASPPIRIGDGATIGGEARIAMGVTVGPGAIVEGFSNVVALTNIGPGEVWGGNPAVFLRRRTDLAPDHAVPVTAPVIRRETSPRRVRRRLGHTRAGPTCCGRGPWSAARCGLHRSLGFTRATVDRHDDRRYVRPPAGGRSDLRAAIAWRFALAMRDAADPPTVAGVSDHVPIDPEWLPLCTVCLYGPLALVVAPAFVGDPITVVVAASFTAEPLAASLRQWSTAFGIDARVGVLRLQSNRAGTFGSR